MSAVMSKNSVKATKASSLKYVLCKIPSSWDALPVHHQEESRPPNRSIELYVKDGTSGNLVYEGYICPPTPETLSMSELKRAQRPKRELTIGKKLSILQKKMQKEEKECEALEKNTRKRKMPKLEDPMSSCNPVQGVSEAKPRTITEQAVDICGGATDLLEHLNVAQKWVESIRNNLNLEHVACSEKPQQIRGQARATYGGPTQLHHLNTAEQWMNPITDHLHVKHNADGEKPQQIQGQFVPIYGGTTELEHLNTAQQWMNPITEHLPPSEIHYSLDSAIPVVRWMDKYINQPYQPWDTDEEINFLLPLFGVIDNPTNLQSTSYEA